MNRSLDACDRAVPPPAAPTPAAWTRGAGSTSRYEVSGSFDLQPGGRQRGGDRRDPAGRGAPVPAPRRRAGRSIPPAPRSAAPTSELRFAKVGGKRLRFETALPAAHARASRSTTSASCARPTSRRGPPGPRCSSGQPNRVFRQLRWNFNNWEYWTIAGLPTERAFNTNVHTQFNNRWWLHMGGTLGQLGATYCDRCARGGPAIRQDAYVSPWLGIEGDDRRPLIPIALGELLVRRRRPLGDASL